MKSSDGSIFRKTLHEIVTTVESAIEWRKIARDWEVSYKSLRSWLGKGQGNRFPAEFVVPLCKTVGNYRLLDCLEEEAGRVAFALPTATPPRVRGRFRDVLRGVLDDPARSLDQRLIAHRLGTDYRQLRYFVSRDEERHLPAEMVVPLCEAVNDFRLLDFLELQAGRLAFSIPDSRQPKASDITELHKMLEDAIEAVRAGSASMRDDIVDEAEAYIVMEKLDIVIRHCVRFRYWVEHQCTGLR